MANKKEIEALLEDPKARELLRDAGFRLQRNPDQLVAKTFRLPKDLIEEFYGAVQKKGLKIQDAVEAAISEWVKKNQ